MDLLDKLILEWGYRCEKGYPDLNNEKDLAVFESLFGFDLKEVALRPKELEKINSRTGVGRVDILIRKIKNKEPLELESGEKPFLVHDPDGSKVKELENWSGEKGPVTLQDEEGNTISTSELKKTAEFGGTGKSKEEREERQERAFIEFVNSVEGVKTLVGANGKKIDNVESAGKVEMPGYSQEPYSDIALKIKNGPDHLISAKGTAAPTLGGGGLIGMTSMGPDVVSFVENFYEKAFDFYEKELNAKNLSIQDDLKSVDGFKDVSLKIPTDVVTQVLKGTKEIGGPVDSYYIGPMDSVEDRIQGNTLYLQGDLLPVEEYASSKEFYAVIRKRGGSFYFSDMNTDVGDISIPVIFANTPQGSGRKSRFIISSTPRGTLLK
jgi:hypothetical protein